MTEKKRNRKESRKGNRKREERVEKRIGREEKVAKKNVTKKRNRSEKEFTKMGHEGIDMSSAAHAQHSLKQERSNNIDYQLVQL